MMDWHKSVYRAEHEQREAKLKVRETVWGLIFWLALAAAIIGRAVAMKPTKPINVTGRPDWRYTSAAHTDVAATIRRAQKQIEIDKAQQTTVLAKRRVGEK